MRVAPAIVAVLQVALLTACGGETGVPCSGATFCIGTEVYRCEGGGQGAFVMDCRPDHYCFNGQCILQIIGADPGPDLAAEVLPEPGPDIAEPLDAVDAADAVEAAEDVAPDAAEPDDAAAEADPDPVDVAIPDEGVTDPVEPDEPGDDAEADVEPPDRDETDLLEDTALDPAADPEPDLAPDPAQDLAGEETTPVAECGNGKLDPGEECDGVLLGGKGCGSLGYIGGTLSCKKGCKFETILCGTSSHTLGYAPVVNTAVKAAWRDVAWAPDGSYALLVGNASGTGVVAKYDPADGSLTSLGSLGCEGWRVAFAATGDAYVTGAVSAGSGKLFHVPSGATSLAEVTTAAGAAYQYKAIVFDEAGATAYIGGGNTNIYNPIIAAYRFDPAAGSSTFLIAQNVGQLNSVDVMHVPASVLGAYGEGLVLVPSLSGSVLVTLKAPDKVSVSCGGCGNMGRGGWRPGGTYGVIAGTSSNALYIFDGATLTMDGESCVAGLGSCSNCGCGHANAVAWRPDGKRALILGASSQASQFVLEHRPKSSSWNVADLLTQPAITPWNASPYLAPSGAELRAAAFRPGVLCDQGLMVGDANTLGYGIVVAFQDTDAHDCPF
jgi:hypothetical protein